MKISGDWQHLFRCNRMRLVFFILLIQFVTSAFAQANVQEYTAHEKAAYNAQHETGICLDIFCREDSEEKNESYKAIATAELADFSFQTSVLTQFHSHSWDVNGLSFTHNPLFKLNCSLRI